MCTAPCHTKLLHFFPSTFCSTCNAYSWEYILAYKSQNLRQNLAQKVGGDLSAGHKINKITSCQNTEFPTKCGNSNAIWMAHRTTQSTTTRYLHRRTETVTDRRNTSYIMMQDDQSHASNLISTTNELVQYNKRQKPKTVNIVCLQICLKFLLECQQCRIFDVRCQQVAYFWDKGLRNSKLARRMKSSAPHLGSNQ